MGKIAVLVPWLQRLFPPAELPGAQPLEVSGDISYVHPVFSGNDDLGPAEESNSVGAAGVSAIDLVGPRDNFFTIIHAAEASHDDPIARKLFFNLNRGPAVVSLQIGDPPTEAPGVTFGLGRTILVPPGWSFGVFINVIGAPNFLSGSVVFTRVPVGHPHQHV